MTNKHQRHLIAANPEFEKYKTPHTLIGNPDADALEDVVDIYPCEYKLFHVDQQGITVETLGVRYEDVNVKPGFVYIYKVTSLVPETIALITNNITIVNSKLIYKACK